MDDETVFDGAAISQADREFLESLDDHPLRRDPRYGTPCPPQPNFGAFDLKDPVQIAKRREYFAQVVDWMLVNYAYREGAFMGKGGAISLVNGEVITLADLRGRMAPRSLLDIGPRGAIKTRSPVDTWLIADERLSIHHEEMRPDQPRPTFIEDGCQIFNRYRPRAHPTTGGDLTVFLAFFERLIPDPVERAWMWHWLSHKVRRPWVPMVAVIMVAEKFGSGRGTLFAILQSLFGKAYVWPCAFGDLTGTSASARFNAQMADALVALVNEAVDEEGHHQSRQRFTYEAWKNVIEPSPIALKRFEAKNQHAFTQVSAMSIIVATNHRNVLKLPADDRRTSVLTCGAPLTITDRHAIQAWMANPENIGALLRALLDTPAAAPDVFDPFGTPPAFAGRREMIGMAKSGLEDAYEAAMTALADAPLFTLTQAVKLISYFAGSGYERQDRAKYMVAMNAFRLRERGEPYDRIRYGGRQEILYARTDSERQLWLPAQKEMVVAALDRAEACVASVINTGLAAAAFKKERRLAPEEEN